MRASPLFKHHEARAGQFRGGLEIHLPERLAELEVLLGREGVVALGAEVMMLDIGGLVRTIGHFVARQVRYFGEFYAQLFG